MLSYKMDFSSCNIIPGFSKSSHIYGTANLQGNECLQETHELREKRERHARNLRATQHTHTVQLQQLAIIIASHKVK